MCCRKVNNVFHGKIRLSLAPAPNPNTCNTIGNQTNFDCKASKNYVLDLCQLPHLSI